MLTIQPKISNNSTTFGRNKDRRLSPEELEEKNYQTARREIEEQQDDFLELAENKDFMRALLLEAMSGNHKFGKDSDCAANCVFVWSNNASKNKFYTSIEEYVDHILQDKLKVEISWKTGGSTSYQVLRIVTK